MNTNCYTPRKNSREHFVINTVIINAWSRVFVTAVLKLFLTIVNCNETLNMQHAMKLLTIVTGSSILDPSLLMVFLYMFYFASLLFIFPFFYSVLLFHAETQNTNFILVATLIQF